MASTTINLPIPGSRIRWLALGLAGGALIAAIASPAFAPRPIYGVGTDGTDARAHDQRHRHRPGRDQPGRRRPPGRRAGQPPDGQGGPRGRRRSR